MIDLHCHALPGIDDGPADIYGSIALARAARDGGTSTLVTTPHIDHWWGVDPASLPRRVAEVGAVLEREGIDVELRTGGEISLTRVIDLEEHELDGLALGGGRHVLLEAPLTPGAGDFEALILAVLERRPVLLAHPERCPLARAGVPDELATWLTAAVPSAIVERAPIPERPAEVLRPRA